MYVAEGITIETKATIKTGSGVNLDKFNTYQKYKITKIMNDLWGIQMDLVTQKRVLEALNLADIPENFLAEITANLEYFRNYAFDPVNTKLIDAAANVSTNEINQAINGNLFFNPGTKPVVEYVEREGLQLVKSLEYTVIENLKRTIADGLTKNYTWPQIRRMMMNDMVLTKTETIACKRIFDSCLAEGKPVQQALGEMNRKATYLKRVRAERIARTEITRAKHNGDIFAYKQSIDSGKVKAATKTWYKTNLKDNWESSDLYDGSTVDIDGSFDQYGTPSYTTMTDFGYPSEINEYCILEYEIKA